MSAVKDLTKGSVPKNLIIFAIPFFISNLLQAIYNFADLVFVGWFCSDAEVVGVTNGAQIMTVLTNIIVGLSIGATVLTARYFGAKQFDRTKTLIVSVVRLFFGIGVVLSIAVIAGSGLIVWLMRVPQSAVGATTAYIIVCGSALFAIMVQNAIAGIMRGLGDSKRPMYIVVVALVINFCMDFVFAAVFNMGAFGAALSTALCQVLSCFALFVLLRRTLRSMEGEGRFCAKELRGCIALGLPTACQQLFVQMSFVFLLGLANGYGESAAAAYGYIGRINGFAIMPSAAIMASIAAITGQCMGAEKPRRAFGTLMVGIAILIPFGVMMTSLIYVFAEGVLHVFTNSPNVISFGVGFLRACAVEYITVSCIFCLHGFTNGMGKTVFTMINGILTSVVVRVPLAFGLSSALGFNGIGYAIALSPLFPTVLAAVFVALLWQKSKTHTAPQPHIISEE